LQKPGESGKHVKVQQSGREAFAAIRAARGFYLAIGGQNGIPRWQEAVEQL
jgi:hypothetical protein